MDAKVISWLAILACGAAMAGERVVHEVVWSDWQASGRLQQGEVQSEPDGKVGEFLRVETAESGTTTIPILVLDSPGVTSPHYAITGQIRYSGVQSDSYLEMWNHFRGGGQYFTRTLDDTGPMGKIQGDSDWRAISLPFHSSADERDPQKLVVNVVLNGPGVVDIGPLQLCDVTGISMASSGGWWSLPVSIAIGVGGGTLLGLIGAAIGILTSLGVGRRFVLFLTYGATMVGIVLTCVGLAALLSSQPFYVVYPVLLVGLLAACIMGTLGRTIRRRFQEIELRKMSAMDAR